MSKKFSSVKNRRGQGLVEYIIIVASVAMISLVAVSIFGHKVADQYAIGAGMLPGAHSEDNLAIATGDFAGSAVVAGAQTGTGAVSWASITGSAPAGPGLVNNVVVAQGVTPGPVDGDAFVAD